MHLVYTHVIMYHQCPQSLQLSTGCSSEQANRHLQYCQVSDAGLCLVETACWVAHQLLTRVGMQRVFCLVVKLCAATTRLCCVQQTYCLYTRSATLAVATNSMDTIDAMQFNETCNDHQLNAQLHNPHIFIASTGTSNTNKLGQ